MVPFATPRTAPPILEMAEGAIRAALADAGLEFGDVQQAYAGYVYGDSTMGQAAIYRVGATGIPIVNVNNNCSTGSTALWLARQAIESGEADCVLALGFEQMQRGAIQSHWTDRPSPFDVFQDAADAAQGPNPGVPIAAQWFGGAGQQYADRWGVEPETFAAVTVKSRLHAVGNPYAVFREPVTLEQVLASDPVFGPLTRLQCCPPTCGAAAAILCSDDFAKTHGIDAGVRIRGQALTTDTRASFDGDLIDLVGYDMSAAAARQVYDKSGVDPLDLRVVELHDCFTANEILSYEALSLTPPGTAARFIADGDNTYGGRVVTNPSGGLLSKGHPLGASGLAQCAELVWQLTGRAGPRQVDDVTIALQHNIGIGGAAVVTLYESVA